MRNRQNYEVYHRRYIAAMSEEEGEPMDETSVAEPDYEEPETETETPAGIQLEGYTTEFDIKVALTPVELVPVSEVKK